MDQERERIQEDLRGLIAGDVRCDDAFLQLYSSDASIYEVRPLAVIRPRGVSDVIACVRYAAEEGIAIPNLSRMNSPNAVVNEFPMGVNSSTMIATVCCNAAI